MVGRGEGEVMAETEQVQAIALGRSSLVEDKYQTAAWAENPSWFGFQNNQKKRTLLSGFPC